MARLNPRRRLLAKQGAILAQARIARALEGDDSAMLQQGSPTTSLMTYQNHVSMRGPSFRDGSKPRAKAPTAKPNNREGHVDTLRLKAQILLLAKKNREG